jgi:nitroreductase
MILVMPHPKHAAADHEVLDLIRERWSPRAYDAGKPVPAIELWRLFEAARWAPSSRNEQPWRFVVIDREAHGHIHEAVVTTMSRGNQAWAPAAPVLVMVAVKLTVGDSDEANRHAYYDTGHAVALLTLQAQAAGLGVRQMEGFNRTAASRIVGVPDNYDAVVLMAIGYPAAPEVLENEKHRELELTPRQRRKANEMVYGGEWGREFAAF